MEQVPPAPAPRRDLMLAGWYGLGVVVLASTLGAVISRGLIPLVSESIKTALHLSDSQLGLINGLALTFVTALFTVPVGWLADRIDRRWLLAVSVMIWSIATAGFAFATSFGPLLLFAMGIAAGEAVLGPIVYSVIPDMFPRRAWVTANSVFMFGNLLGTYLGVALIGALLGWLGGAGAPLMAYTGASQPWRATLVFCAYAGPVLAIMILAMRLKRSTPEPRQGARVDGLFDYFRRHARSVAGIFLGFGLSYAAYGALASWGAVILVRLFHADPAMIAQVMGYGAAIGSMIGIGMGLLCVRLLRPRFGDETPMVVAQIALLLGFLVTIFMPFVRSATQFYAIMLVKLTLTFMATSLSPTVLQMIAPARMRGRVVAIGGMVMILFQSVMPWLIGVLSDQLFPGQRGILIAMTVVVLPALLAGLLLLAWGSRTLQATLRDVAERDARAVAQGGGAEPAAVPA